MAVQDKTWEVAIRVKVTTMCGWQPEREDIEGWLDGGGAFELVSIDSVQETG